MKTILGIVSIASLAWAVPCRAQAPACPSTTFTCDGATLSLSGDQDSRQCINDFGVAGANFDYSVGTGEIHYGNVDVVLGTRDNFWFEGSPGQVVHARAVLTYNGQACSGDVGSTSGSFEITPGDLQTFIIFSPFQGCRTDNQTLSQDVAFEVGQTFTIAVGHESGNAGSGGSGFLSTTVKFEELPANVIVRSCHGYRQDGPVAAMTKSWGAVKSIYRGER